MGIQYRKGEIFCVEFIFSGDDPERRRGGEFLTLVRRYDMTGRSACAKCLPFCASAATAARAVKTAAKKRQPKSGPRTKLERTATILLPNSVAPAGMDHASEGRLGEIL